MTLFVRLSLIAFRTVCLLGEGGFLKTEQIGRVNALLARATKYRFTDNLYDFMRLYKSTRIIHCLKLCTTNVIV